MRALPGPAALVVAAREMRGDGEPLQVGRAEILLGREPLVHLRPRLAGVGITSELGRTGHSHSLVHRRAGSPRASVRHPSMQEPTAVRTAAGAKV